MSLYLKDFPACRACFTDTNRPPVAVNGLLYSALRGFSGSYCEEYKTVTTSRWPDTSPQAQRKAFYKKWCIMEIVVANCWYCMAGAGCLPEKKLLSTFSPCLLIWSDAWLREWCLPHTGLFLSVHALVVLWHSSSWCWFCFIFWLCYVRKVRTVF